MASSFEQLTSTTAPGKVFANRSEMAEHYKSDWHKYNLKRRQAGLPVLLEADFQARLQAAQALRAEQAQQQAAAGKDHLKKKKKNKKEMKKNHKKQQTQPPNQGDAGASASASAHVSSQAAAYDRIKKQKGDGGDDDTKSIPKEEEVAEPDPQRQQLQDEPETRDEETQPTAAAAEEMMIEIDPRQCLFDRHYSTSVQANVCRMQRKFGFFVPDQEYLVDMEGLIGYLHEKIKLGLTCLYCQKTGFAHYTDVQRHMISKHHTKLLYEADVDLPDLAVFYDFGAANQEFLMGSTTAKKKAVTGSDNGDFEVVSGGGDGEEGDHDDDEWEDISDDDEDEMERKEDDADEEEEDDDDDLYDGYQQEVARMGLDVTPLGELIFPDGRIIGHRALRRYYKQQRAAAPLSSSSVSVLAARKAAGERLYRGRVYNIGGGGTTTGTGADAASTSNNALALTKAGIAPGLAAGRASKGLLVPMAGSSSSYSQLSIYRYRAAVRKQRRGERQGQRLHQKTNQNINRMDKKHNRLMNGVSVAHAAR